MLNKITTYEFFDLVHSGELGELDTENYIQELTENYKIEKLKSLLNDIEYCLSCAKEEKESEYKQKDIAAALSELSNKNKEIPYIEFPQLKGKNGEIASKQFKILDLEKIFFPYDFFLIYRLLNKIKVIIKNIENPSLTQNYEMKKEHDYNIKPEESKLIHFLKGNSKILSTWDFLTKTGFIKNLQEKYNATLNPTHNVDLLKETRLKQFKEWQTEFVNERNLNHLEITAFDMNCLYIRWLNHELKVIDQWLSEKYPNGEPKKIKESLSTEIEITKYQDYIKNETKIVDKEIRGYKSQSDIAGGELEFWFNLTTEQKYKVAFQTYNEKLPHGTVEDFHSMEIEHQKSFILKYENMENRNWWETKCLIEARKVLEYIKGITSPTPKTEVKTEQETKKSFIANEYALAYVFDLYASGQQIPINRRDGGYDKKELIRKGFELYQLDKNKDKFYRSVKHVASLDLNKQLDLMSISKNWIEAVKTLSKDWQNTETYLKGKALIGE